MSPIQLVRTSRHVPLARKIFRPLFSFRAAGTATVESSSPHTTLAFDTEEGMH